MCEGRGNGRGSNQVLMDIGNGAEPRSMRRQWRDGFVRRYGRQQKERVVNGYGQMMMMMTTANTNNISPAMGTPIPTNMTAPMVGTGIGAATMAAMGMKSAGLACGTSANALALSVGPGHHGTTNGTHITTTTTTGVSSIPTTASPLPALAMPGSLESLLPTFTLSNTTSSSGPASHAFHSHGHAIANTPANTYTTNATHMTTTAAHTNTIHDPAPSSFSSCMPQHGHPSQYGVAAAATTNPVLRWATPALTPATSAAVKADATSLAPGVGSDMARSAYEGHVVANGSGEAGKSTPEEFLTITPLASPPTPVLRGISSGYAPPAVPTGPAPPPASSQAPQPPQALRAPQIPHAPLSASMPIPTHSQTYQPHPHPHLHGSMYHHPGEPRQLSPLTQTATPPPSIVITPLQPSPQSDKDLLAAIGLQRGQPPASATVHGQGPVGLGTWGDMWPMVQGLRRYSADDVTTAAAAMGLGLRGWESLVHHQEQQQQPTPVTHYQQHHHLGTSLMPALVPMTSLGPAGSGIGDGTGHGTHVHTTATNTAATTAVNAFGTAAAHHHHQAFIPTNVPHQLPAVLNTNLKPVHGSHHHRPTKLHLPPAPPKPSPQVLRLQHYHHLTRHLNFDDITVSELKDHLRKLGLQATGKKAVLVLRLQEEMERMRRELGKRTSEDLGGVREERGSAKRVKVESGGGDSLLSNPAAGAPAAGMAVAVASVPRFEPVLG